MLRRVSGGLKRAAGFRICAHTNAPSHALCREEAHHARLPGVCAAPRWLESVHGLRKPTTPARRPSFSVHGRAPTCQPQPPTSGLLAHMRTRERAIACSHSGGDIAHALAPRAHRTALVGVGPCLVKAHYAIKTAAPPRCTPVLRRTSRGLQRAAGIRMCSGCSNAPPRALSREV